MFRSNLLALVVVSLVAGHCAGTDTSDSCSPQRTYKLGPDYVAGRFSKIGVPLTITTPDGRRKLKVSNPEVLAEAADRCALVHGVIKGTEIKIISVTTLDQGAEPLDTALLQAAAYREDPSMIEQLIKLGANANVKTAEGSPALIEAIESNIMRLGGPSLAAAKALLEHNADPNVPGIYGETALSHAAFSGNIEIAELLLAHGAKVDYRSHSGITALMEARTPEMVSLLIRAGASVDEQDDEGRTALMQAVQECDVELTRAFVTGGANVHLKSNKGLSALDQAARGAGRTSHTPTETDPRCEEVFLIVNEKARSGQPRDR